MRLEMTNEKNKVELIVKMTFKEKVKALLKNSFMLSIDKSVGSEPDSYLVWYDRPHYN